MEGFEAWSATVFLKGCDQNKYGSVLKGLANQYALGNDQYPRRIMAATDVLSNHKLDQKFFDLRKKSRNAYAVSKDEGTDNKKWRLVSTNIR